MNKKKSLFKIDKVKFYYQQLGTVEPSFCQKIKLIIPAFGLHAVAVYRFGKFSRDIYLRNKITGIPLRIIYYTMSFFIELLHHIDINQFANIGPGLYIPHGVSIFIPSITIGENFTIHHNVTIGKGFSEEPDDYPTIGNNVWVGTNSVIYGKIKIGDGATISAGSILSKDVPEKCVVSGNPARIILQNYINNNLNRYKITNN